MTTGQGAKGSKVQDEVGEAAGTGPCRTLITLEVLRTAELLNV